MSSGQIMVGELNGVHVLRFLGDVRLTLCPALDNYLEQALQNPKFCNVVIDLSDTQGIDSTSLGILAKLTLHMRNKVGKVPTLISINQNITKILISMGFDKVFNLVIRLQQPLPECHKLPVSQCSDAEMQGKVLEAHKTLMSLNSENEKEFKHLVDALESHAS